MGLYRGWADTDPGWRGKYNTGWNSSEYSFHPTALTVLSGREAVWLEPVAAVGQPPTGDADRDGGRQGPPERKRNVGDQAEDSEGGPEDFSLHDPILNRLSVYYGALLFLLDQDLNTSSTRKHRFPGETSWLHVRPKE